MDHLPWWWSMAFNFYCKCVKNKHKNTEDTINNGQNPYQNMRGTP
jgi:hypothetical protein